LKATHFVSALIVFVLASGSLLSAETTADPREKLDTAITEAIRLLEAKEYATVLQEYFYMGDLQNDTTVSFDEILRIFANKKASRLLKALKATKSLTPVMEDKGKKATFKFKEPIERAKSITFIKIDKFWYIQN